MCIRDSYVLHSWIKEVLLFWHFSQSTTAVVSFIVYHFLFHTPLEHVLHILKVVLCSLVTFILDSVCISDSSKSTWSAGAKYILFCSEYFHWIFTLQCLSRLAEVISKLFLSLSQMICPFKLPNFQTLCLLSKYPFCVVFPAQSILLFNLAQ